MPTPTAKILIVDDSRAFSKGLGSILESSQYELFFETSPVVALSKIDAIAPDIIISDLEMPEMHGFEFIKKLRLNQSLSTVPIMVLTSSNDTDSMSQSILSGADAFCSKDTIRHTIQPQILAMLRLKKIFEGSIRGKQLEAVKALIDTYKHEFGNALTILEGMLRKLSKNHLQIVEDPAMHSIVKSVDRLKETLNKLNELRNYQEESYSLDSKILKVG